MSRIEKLDMWKLELPFRVAFKHAGTSRSVTESVWVEAADGHGVVGYGESCPRSYVTGETTRSCAEFLATHHSCLLNEIRDVAGLRSWVNEHSAEIDAAPAAWCAVELALLDLFSRQSSCTVEELLGVGAVTGPFQYTAVLGEQNQEKFSGQVALYRKWGFEEFKVKLGGNPEQDAARLDCLIQAGVPPENIRLDANNLWGRPGDALEHLRPLARQFVAIEEPLRSKCIKELRKLGETLERPVILDESFLRASRFADIESDPSRWWINVRVSKMGGIVRALEIVGRAAERGIAVIVGAQVGETSLLTRAGLTVARQARGNLRGQEGAFGTHLLAADVVEPPLMFGRHGRLEGEDHPQLGKPLAVIRPEEFLSAIPVP